jgi:uncharacterized protein (TIGR02996 family)
MTHEEAFLRAIREAPDDDGPRLVYADWLEERGDPRGEFIRVQCARALLDPPDKAAQRKLLEASSKEIAEVCNRRAELHARAWNLLEANRRAWADPVRAVIGPDPSRRGEYWLGGRRPNPDKFWRGFVNTLAFDAAALGAAPPEAARLLVLHRGDVYGAGRGAAALAASPLLAPLTALQFADLYDAPLDPAGAAALAASPYLTRLTSLFLARNNIGDDGARALARAPWLLGLRILDLTENGLSEAALRVLVVSPYLSRRCTVRLARNAISPGTVDRLARMRGYSRSQFRI